jgi:hypothetical protein
MFTDTFCGGQPYRRRRVELRDHLRLDTRGTVQYWSLRGAVVFR